MTTNLAYNNVEIRNCQTLSFNQEVEYEASGTDVLYHKFTIRVQGLVHSNVEAHGITAGTTGNAQSLLLEVRRRLLQPRGVLQYYQVRQPGSKSILVAASPHPAHDSVDVNNGPKPVSANVTYIAGLQSFQVEFEVIACVRICYNVPFHLPDYGALRSGYVLNNRWSVTDTKDRNFATTRTWEGVLRVAHAGYYPHIFRAMVAPALRAGYQRVQQRFMQTEDGLSLKWSITDRQRHAAPPLPAVDWQATQRDSMDQTLTTGIATLDVSLTGLPGVSKTKLIAAALGVVADRYRGIRSAGTSGSYHLLEATIIDTMHEPHVRVIASFRVSGQSGQRLFNIASGQLGKPLEAPNYNSQRWPVPSMYDVTSPAAVFATYWQNPCEDPHGMPRVISLTSPDGSVETEPEEDPGDDPQPPEISLVDNADDVTFSPPPNHAMEHDDSPYTHVTIESEYEGDTGQMILPIAACNTPPTAGIPFVGTAAAAAPEPTVVFIPSHLGVMYRKFIMHAERIGKQPSLPPIAKTLTDPNGITETLVSVKVMPDAPPLEANGTDQLFVTRVVYTYALSRPIQAGEKFRVGSSPIDNTTPADNALPVAAMNGNVQ